MNVPNVMSAVLVICQQMKNFSQEMPTMKEVNKFHCDAAVKEKLNKKKLNCGMKRWVRKGRK